MSDRLTEAASLRLLEGSLRLLEGVVVEADCGLLLEGGYAFLDESSLQLLLESCPVTAIAPTAHGGHSRRGPHGYSTDDLRLREEEELLVLV